MKRYDVTFYFTRKVSFEVDATNLEDAETIAWDNIQHYEDEECVETEVEEIDPDES